MTVNAMRGLLSFGQQEAKIGEAGVFDPTKVAYNKVRSPRIEMGLVEDNQLMPLQVGGVLRPTGAFKQGYYFGGDADIFPYVSGSFGWLLKAALGAVTTTAGHAGETVVTGVNTHVFNPKSDDDGFQPWMSFRTMIPGADPTDDEGQAAFDCKVVGLRFTIPAKGKVVCRLSVLGRDVVIDDDPSAWAYVNASMEDDSVIPEAGRGVFEIGGVEYPLVGAVIDIQNGTTTPDEEAVIGQFTMDDIMAKSRPTTIRIVYKVKDSALYRKIRTGAANGTTWTPKVFETITSGSTKAFKASFAAPDMIGATDVPNTLIFEADKVAWQSEGPIQLQAGNVLSQTFTGTVLDPGAAKIYLSATLYNAQADYADPAA